MTYEREQSEDLLTYNMQNQPIYIGTNKEGERERERENNANKDRHEVTTIRVIFAQQGRFHVDCCHLMTISVECTSLLFFLHKR